jgi:hypothetical protein
MDALISFFIILGLISLFYFIYYWINSEILSESEIKTLALSRRFDDAYKYFGFTYSQYVINKEFKSKLNKKGEVYSCDNPLSIFPSIISALLKGKKHEWVVFAFVKNQTVFAFYTNKGDDNQSVSVNTHPVNLGMFASKHEADLILQFHNHPNAVLSTSKQDIISADYFGELFTKHSVNYLAFVCGAGNYYQYSWWLTDSFFTMNNYFEIITREDIKSRSSNFKLRKELNRKKSFMRSCLEKNKSHNIYT